MNPETYELVPARLKKQCGFPEKYEDATPQQRELVIALSSSARNLGTEAENILNDLLFLKQNYGHLDGELVYELDNLISEYEENI